MRIVANGFSEKTIDTSLTTSETESIQLHQFAYAAVSISYPDTVEGDFKLEESIDGEEWFDVPNSGINVAGGSAGKHAAQLRLQTQ